MEKSASFINRVFNVRPGDFCRGLPLFAYYFLIISSYGMGRTARDSLFLDQFKAVQLPYADIAVAGLVGFIVALYIRLGRVVNLRSLQFVTLILFSLCYLGLWWGIHRQKLVWASPTLYIFVGIFGVVAVTQVWTLANFLWTTREAKRLFGMLGSGGILGGIFAGFVSARFTRSFGAESLLLLMAFPLAFATWIVIAVWERRPPQSASRSVVRGSAPRTLTD